MPPCFWFALYTGFRVAELARLRWRDIDLNRALLFIWEQKNRKEETLPIAQIAVAILEVVPQRAPESYVFQSQTQSVLERSDCYFAERLSKTFRRGRALSGIKRKISLHGLRQGYCTLLAEAGKSAHVIQGAPRRADIATSARYQRE